ncbi:CAP domain-containing protein [Amaricoccus sp.]|uniref:CAP domain-containing protein n=1 Tax=Amaricoccus sp. TaxID=1872485 RepID=UPI0026370F81|nr:CAP domain-containing protein [Amaricoccus sp.]HRO11751.1 CAP domain-containing protein [Amaricoccus sp.]
MFRPFLAALAVLLALSACESSQGGGKRLTQADVNPIRLRHLDAVNAVRAEHGAQPVQLSAELNAAAETHARDMSVQKRAWHFGSDLTSPRERAFRAGYRGEIVGENLSEGSDSDLTVLQSWLGYSDTRAVILDPAARGLGIGWYEDATGKIWWVQLLGE